MEITVRHDGLELGLDVPDYWSSPATVNAGPETLVRARSTVGEDFKGMGFLYRVSKCMYSVAVPAENHSVSLLCNHISSSQLHYPPSVARQVKDSLPAMSR